MRVLLMTVPLLLAAGPARRAPAPAKVSVSSLSNKEVASLVKAHTKNHGRTLAVRGPEGTQSVWPRDPDAPKLAELPRTTLVGLYTVLQLPSPEDAEFDLLIDGPEGTVNVSVWVSEAGHVVVEQGSGYAPPPAMDPAAFTAKWPDNPLVEEGAPWTPELVGMLDATLAELSARDRARIAGVALVRRPAPRKRVAAAGEATGRFIRMRTSGYFEDADDTPRIELYNNGVPKNETGFVGSVGRPFPRTCFSIMRQVGHRIALQPDTGLGPVDDDPEAPIDDGTTSEKARAALKNPRELAFSYAYALYHLDPESLERTAPDVFAWMKQRSGS